MAIRQEIQYIHKTPRFDQWHAIEAVGWVTGAWTIQRYDLATACELSMNGVYEFYVAQGGRQVDVKVYRSPSGHLFLQTEPDGWSQNNLLSLPEFLGPGLLGGIVGVALRPSRY
jgi:hypothetical protein